MASFCSLEVDSRKSVSFGGNLWNTTLDIDDLPLLIGGKKGGTPVSKRPCGNSKIRRRAMADRAMSFRNGQPTPANQESRDPKRATRQRNRGGKGHTLSAPSAKASACPLVALGAQTVQALAVWRRRACHRVSGFVGGSVRRHVRGLAMLDSSLALSRRMR